METMLTCGERNADEIVDGSRHEVHVDPLDRLLRQTYGTDDVEQVILFNAKYLTRIYTKNNVDIVQIFNNSLG